MTQNTTSREETLTNKGDIYQRAKTLVWWIKNANSEKEAIEHTTQNFNSLLDELLSEVEGKRLFRNKALKETPEANRYIAYKNETLDEFRAIINHKKLK